jgi:hypothetical protein
MNLWLGGGISKRKVSSFNTPSMDELTEENTVAGQSVMSQHTKERGEGDKRRKGKYDENYVFQFCVC